jgi:hypothetical protein
MAARKDVTAASWALDQLNAGNSITHPDAIMAGKGWRLAARIYDLRKLGVQIVTRRDRGGRCVYSLPDDRQLELLVGAGGTAPGTASKQVFTKEAGGDHAA